MKFSPLCQIRSKTEVDIMRVSRVPFDCPWGIQLHLTFVSAQATAKSALIRPRWEQSSRLTDFCIETTEGVAVRF